VTTLETARFAPDRPAARYEFRCWPDEPPPAIGQLEAHWPETGSEARTDIYLLPPESRCRLVKLRHGTRLETKRLEATPEALQLWTMPLSVDFPLGCGSLASVLDSLGIAAPVDPAALLSPAHFLAGIAGRSDVRPINVTKARRLFTRGGCRAEVTTVAIGDRRLLSLAIEADEAGEAVRALEDLDLRGFPNRHYGEILAQFVR